MTNAEKYCFADFTRANYRRILVLAKQAFPLKMYDSFDRTGRFILWRHDIDFSMHAALKLAQIEHEEGVKATYFVHIHNEFYNLHEREVSGKLAEIVKLGHHIGLHFDSEYTDISSEHMLVRELELEKVHLEELIKRTVRVFSFHRPSSLTMRYVQQEYAGMINVYSDYFGTHVGYCSDSNGFWRNRRLEDVLIAGTDDRLQVLTHPAWWQDAIMSPRERIERCIAGRADSTRRTYRETLRTSGRPDIDW